MKYFVETQLLFLIVVVVKVIQFSPLLWTFCHISYMALNNNNNNNNNNYYYYYYYYYNKPNILKRQA